MGLNIWTVIAPACFAIATMAPATAQAQTVRGEPSAALKTCITSNASAVELAIPSLEEAVNFLVQNLCAAPLSEQRDTQQKELQDRMIAAQRERTAAMCDAMAATPDDDDSPAGGFDYMAEMCNSDAAADWQDELAYTDIFAAYTGNTGINSPAATTLAAQLLLKYRVERLNKKP